MKMLPRAGAKGELRATPNAQQNHSAITLSL